MLVRGVSGRVQLAAAAAIAAIVVLGACAAEPPAQPSWRAALQADRAARLAAIGKGTSPARTVDAFFLAYVEQRARLDPNFATRVGIHEHDRRLTRYDDESWRRRQEAAAAALGVASRLDGAGLTATESTDLTLFTSQLLLELHEYERQDARTVDLIFDIPTLIETISRGITLYPGDVIATGTPAGVGMGMSPPTWLKSGDTVRIEIDGIGVLENPIVAH